MFNIKEPEYNDCSYHPINNPVYIGDSSYIHSVKWCDFIGDKDSYLEKAEEIRDNKDDYALVKMVED